MGVDTARKLILGYKWKNELFCSYSADGRMAVSNIDVWLYFGANVAVL